jgi:PST family polysaccharide transporter
MTEGLTGEAFSGLRWNYVGTIARTISSFGIGIVLARILGPKPFGQLAAASLVWGLANQIATGGFSAALIQAPELTERQIRVVFTIQMLFCVTMTTAVILGARYFALAFHDPGIQAVLYAAAPLLLLQPIGQISTGLLKRNLAFHAIQKAEVISYLLGYLAIGVPAAYFGAGVWSLVSAQLAQAMCYSVQVYVHARHSVIPCLDRSGIRLFRYGVQITGGNLVNWGLGNLDNVFVGRTFGAASLGLYSRAFNLAYVPAEGIVSAFQQVLFASCSRTRDNHRLRRAYLASVGAIAAITFPLFWSMAAGAPTVIAALYGSKWLETTKLFRPVAAAIPLFALMALAGPVLAATDNVAREVRAQAAALVIAAAAFAASSHLSMEAVAWAVVFVYAFRCWAVTMPLLRLLSIGWQDIARVVAGPAAAAVTTATAVFMVQWAGSSYGIHGLYRLVGIALTGVMVVGLLLAVAADQILPSELVQPLVKVKAQLPKWIGEVLDIVAARQKSRKKVRRLAIAPR